MKKSLPDWLAQQQQTVLKAMERHRVVPLWPSLQPKVNQTYFFSAETGVPLWRCGPRPKPSKTYVLPMSPLVGLKTMKFLDNCHI